MPYIASHRSQLIVLPCAGRLWMPWGYLVVPRRLDWSARRSLCAAAGFSKYCQWVFFSLLRTISNGQIIRYLGDSVCKLRRTIDVYANLFEETAFFLHCCLETTHTLLMRASLLTWECHYRLASLQLGLKGTSYFCFPMVLLSHSCLKIGIINKEVTKGL